MQSVSSVVSLLDVTSSPQVGARFLLAAFASAAAACTLLLLISWGQLDQPSKQQHADTHTASDAPPPPVDKDWEVYCPHQAGAVRYAGQTLHSHVETSSVNVSSTHGRRENSAEVRPTAICHCPDGAHPEMPVHSEGTGRRSGRPRTRSTVSRSLSTCLQSIFTGLSSRAMSSSAKSRSTVTSSRGPYGSERSAGSWWLSVLLTLTACGLLLASLLIPCFICHVTPQRRFLSFL